MLESLYLQRVPLSDGNIVVADETYLRESILKPDAKIVLGWEAIMPTFQGQINEEEMIRLIAFLKALGPGQTPRRVDSDSAADHPSGSRRRSGAAAGSASRAEEFRRGSSAMSTEVFSPQARLLPEPSSRPAELKLPRMTYLNVAYGVHSWLLTKDHKRIALLYLVSITLMFFLGGAAATLIRLQLLTPDSTLRAHRDLQQAVHHARRDHGVLLLDSRRSRRCWEISSCR